MGNHDAEAQVRSATDLSSKSSQWTVDRHSGRNYDERRVRKTGASEADVRPAFEEIKRDLRQGEVRLLNPAGEVVDSAWAPRLRTRW